MAKYVLIYHAPEAPADATPLTPKELEAIMGDWVAWAGRVGDRLVDFGNPLRSGVRVSKDGGTAPSTREVVGYSIVEADDVDEARALIKGHPHFDMPGDYEIEIHAALPAPAL